MGVPPRRADAVLTRRTKAGPRVEFAHGPLAVRVPAIAVSALAADDVLVIWFEVPEDALPVRLISGALLTVCIDGVERNCMYTGVYASAGEPGDCWAMILLPNAPATA